MLWSMNVIYHHTTENPTLPPSVRTKNPPEYLYPPEVILQGAFEAFSIPRLHCGV